jgi:hypothetical protein
MIHIDLWQQNLDLSKQDGSRIMEAGIKFMRTVAGCTCPDYKKNLDAVKELNTQSGNP